MLRDKRERSGVRKTGHRINPNILGRTIHENLEKLQQDFDIEKLDDFYVLLKDSISLMQLCDNNGEIFLQKITETSSRVSSEPEKISQPIKSSISQEKKSKDNLIYMFKNLKKWLSEKNRRENIKKILEKKGIIGSTKRKKIIIHKKCYALTQGFSSIISLLERAIFISEEEAEALKNKVQFTQEKDIIITSHFSNELLTPLLIKEISEELSEGICQSIDDAINIINTHRSKDSVSHSLLELKTNLTKTCLINPDKEEDIAFELSEKTYNLVDFVFTQMAIERLESRKNSSGYNSAPSSASDPSPCLVDPALLSSIPEKNEEAEQELDSSNREELHNKVRITLLEAATTTDIKAQSKIKYLSAGEIKKCIETAPHNSDDTEEKKEEIEHTNSIQQPFLSREKSSSRFAPIVHQEILRQEKSIALYEINKKAMRYYVECEDIISSIHDAEKKDMLRKSIYSVAKSIFIFAALTITVGCIIHFMFGVPIFSIVLAYMVKQEIAAVISVAALLGVMGFLGYCHLSSKLNQAFSNLDDSKDAIMKSVETAYQEIARLPMSPT